MPRICNSASKNKKGIELNGQSLGDTERVRRGAVDRVMTNIRSGWIMYRDLVPLLTSRGLPLGANGRLYSALLRSVILHGSET